MRILIVSPEANPFARAGALAEIIYGLAKALSQRGDQVAVVLPLYRQVKESSWDLKPTGTSISIPLSIKTLTTDIYTTRLDPGLDFYFIGQDSLYDREGLYGTQFGDYQDNAERFIFFSRAVPELLNALKLHFDVCHCHEWQTGLVPVYIKTLYQDSPYCKNLATVYSVHNVGYQGIFWHYDMALTGLGWELFTPNLLEYYGKINLEKGGLVTADIINTVSQTYRQEILTPEFGFGLEGVFQERAADLYGILNGVDYEHWDPAHDAYLAAPYDARNLAGKDHCKLDLIQHYGLKVSLDQPLIGMTTRLRERKGLDLVREIMPQLTDANIGFVLQGTGEERYQYAFMELQKRYPASVGVKIGYSEETAHKIIAGSDIFLMPSRYEPCGLDQLYCLRYGTIPVVRATGGLKETVVEYDPVSGQGTGFTFSNFDSLELWMAIQRAIALYGNRPSWDLLRRQAMQQEFSWLHAAGQYQELYRKAVQKKLTQAPRDI
ncbi:glycogen synthase GlgA [Desulfobacca acetoxidans]|uniref:Glycogen synthase n=1 Tax=Desulfobacca acetoxidans (strain ATCC 700848 / DSM 11109 / ASRB2) TaxID=880072 RepID=F2NFW4_DESAR|nr:glycogen synthase GlgA [Desulfobacca acetoxidans]AEB10233.1 Glycogen synthase [Desulfobacca acetoxidans DSM 11109]